MTADGERIAKLEARLDHMAETVERMSSKVDELHSLMMQARGARWAIIAVASAAGFFSGKIAGLFTNFVAR